MRTILRDSTNPKESYCKVCSTSTKPQPKSQIIQLVFPIDDVCDECVDIIEFVFRENILNQAREIKKRRDLQKIINEYYETVE